MSRWRFTRPAPGEGDDEQRASLDDAARRAGKARKERGQTRRRTEREHAAKEEPQPPDTPHR